ncbi:flagellin, partial [Rubrimonas cliftonensis]
MSSILTNNSSMVALNTLRQISAKLSDVQGNISTGKKIANARHNAAIWSVSAVMNSDVTGFKAITDSLALGQSTLNVARSGAETVNKLLDELKGRIVASQADNVDRSKIQADAAELRNNINATVAASQFNGLNVLQRNVTDPVVEVLGSLDRDSSGNVTVANIDVARATLEQGAAGTGSGVANGAVESVAATELATTNLTGAIGAGTTYAVGDKIAISLVGRDNGRGIILSYEVTESDTGADGSTAATSAEMVLRASRAMAVQLEAYATAETGAAATTDLANISTQAN